jgi:hypothetical protein
MRLRVSIVIIASLAASCGSPPCTDCPDVSGDYRLIVAATAAASSSCRRFFTDGFALDLNLTQNESQLTSRDPPMTGILRENNNVSFSDFGGRTTDGIPVTLRIHGAFTGHEGAWHFKGTLSGNIQDVTRCGVSAPVEGDSVAR